MALDQILPEKYSKLETITKQRVYCGRSKGDETITLWTPPENLIGSYSACCIYNAIINFNSGDEESIVEKILGREMNNKNEPISCEETDEDYFGLTHIVEVARPVKISLNECEETVLFDEHIFTETDFAKIAAYAVEAVNETDRNAKEILAAMMSQTKTLFLLRQRETITKENF